MYERPTTPDQEAHTSSEAEKARYREAITSLVHTVGTHAAASLVAISALSFDPDRKVNAAEIDTDASWEEVIDVARENVIRGDREIGGVIKVGGDGTLEVDATVGDLLGITMTREYDLTERDAQGVVRECSFHTHPLASAFAGGLLSDEELARVRNDPKLIAPVPPSDTDLPSIGDVGDRLQQEKGIESVRAVFDSGGVWYYRVAEEADFEMHPDMREEHVAQERARRAWDAVVEEQVSMMSSHDVDDLLELAPDSSKRILAYVPQDPEFLEVYKRSILPFIIAADGEGDLAQHFSETQGVQDAYNLFIEVYLRPQERARKIWHDHAQDFSRIYEGVIPEQELATLREQYLNIGYRVRYVSYEELSHEPPCAGVDHQPE